MRGGGEGGERRNVFKATVSKTLPKSVAEYRFVGVAQIPFYCVLI